MRGYAVGVFHLHGQFEWLRPLLHIRSRRRVRAQDTNIPAMTLLLSAATCRNQTESAVVRSVPRYMDRHYRSGSFGLPDQNPRSPMSKLFSRLVHGGWPPAQCHDPYPHHKLQRNQTHSQQKKPKNRFHSSSARIYPYLYEWARKRIQHRYGQCQES